MKHCERSDAVLRKGAATSKASLRLPLPKQRRLLFPPCCRILPRCAWIQEDRVGY